MNMETLLYDELETEFEKIRDLEFGSDQHRAAVDSLAKLMDRAIEMEKVTNDADEKAKARESEEAFKQHTGWNKHLPDPYFVRAGQSMIDRFKDCTIKGMTIAASGFYGPQGRVIRMPLAMPDMLDTFESFRFGDLKVTNFEMEGSAIAGIAAHLGHNAGTVCCIIAHRHHKASNPDYKPQVRKLIELCLDKLAE